MRILRTSRNAADCLFWPIPKGLRIGCFSLQKRLSHFGAKDGQLHCSSTCLRAARYKYLPILKRKIWDYCKVSELDMIPDFAFEKRAESNVLRPFLKPTILSQEHTSASFRAAMKSCTFNCRTFCPI